MLLALQLMRLVGLELVGWLQQLMGWLQQLVVVRQRRVMLLVGLGWLVELKLVLHLSPLPFYQQQLELVQLVLV